MKKKLFKTLKSKGFCLEGKLIENREEIVRIEGEASE